MLPLIKASMRSADLGHLAQQIAYLESAGVDALHFDVMDGRFGPQEISMGPMFLRGLRKYTQLPFEVHLWMEEPERCLDGYIEAGADCLLVHLEACADPQSTLKAIKERGCQAGLAINPGTSVSDLEQYLDQCDQFNIMTILPQQPGVVCDAGVDNLKEVATLVSSLDRKIAIQADGAVSLATQERFVAAGATSLVAGYPIFSQDDFGAAVRELRNPIQSDAMRPGQ